AGCGPFLRPQIGRCGGQFRPVSAGRDAAQRNRSGAAAAHRAASRSRTGRRETPGICSPVIMVAFPKRSAAEDALDARLGAPSRRAQPPVNAPDPAPLPAAVPNIVPGAAPKTIPGAALDIARAPQPASPPTSPAPHDVSEGARFLLAREYLLARLIAELTPERISILSRSELAKVVDAAVQAYFVRNGLDPDPIAPRALIPAR